MHFTTGTRLLLIPVRLDNENTNKVLPPHVLSESQAATLALPRLVPIAVHSNA
jgi:hypothetical protein